MRILASGICSLALVLSGCYVTVPVTPSALQPGARVRVQLTEQGADDLARYLGPSLRSAWSRVRVAVARVGVARHRQSSLFERLSGKRRQVIRRQQTAVR